MSAHGNKHLEPEEIETLWHFNQLQSGHKKLHLIIKYILDRRKYEKTRWLPSLTSFDRPIHICWGEDDQVARVEMADYLKKSICPDARLTKMPGVGHFGQLGSPDKWLDAILPFYGE